MLSEEQQVYKKYKIKIVVDRFLKGKNTINEISKETGISSSTVQRYLNNELMIREIYGKDAEFIIEEIERRLQENKIEGLSRGGQNFIKNNIPIKDVNGHFTGSKKR